MITKHFLKKLKTGNFCDFTRLFGLVSIIFFLAIFGFFSPILVNSATSNKINLELILVESSFSLSSSSQAFSPNSSSISNNFSTNSSVFSASKISDSSSIPASVSKSNSSNNSILISNNSQNISQTQSYNSQNIVYSTNSLQKSQNNNPLDYVQNTIRTGGFGLNWFLSGLVILALLVIIFLRSKLKIQLVSKQIISKNSKNKNK